MAKVVLSLSAGRSVVQDSGVEVAERKRKQTGVFPWAFNDEGELFFLLIRSSHAGNWTFPKGKKEKHLGKKESAGVEAWEEAGLEGKIGKKLGSFEYRKGSTGVLQTVTLYPMRIKKVEKIFPEQWRERKWFSYEQAMKKLPKNVRPFLTMLYNRIQEKYEA